MDFIDYIRDIEAKVALADQWISYVVLDHAVSIDAEAVKERDSHGKLFVRVSPAMLEALKTDRLRYDPDKSLRERRDRANAHDLVIRVPIYRREDMPEGWPY